MEADGSANLELKDGWHFVSGGDHVDKGGSVGGSVRVCRTLLRLKRKYGNRVRLLLGNRDLNKMRMTSELADDEIVNYERVPGPSWVPEAKRVSPRMHLRKLAAVENRMAPEMVNADMLVSVNTLANRIRWMLKETMGADGEFERRQAELTHIRADGVAASDDDTVASFVESVQPGGFMHDLLFAGELAVLIGSTLYVHGGLVHADLGCDGFGFVPGRQGRLTRNAAAWVAALNEWKTSQLQEWAAQPRWHEPAEKSYGQRKGGRGGSSLIWYGTMAETEPSVVLGRHLGGNGMPLPTPLKLSRQLHAVGVHRLVTGHTPHGDCPTVIKGAYGSKEGSSLEVLMADTSYSNMKAGDNRGEAVSALCMLPDGSLRVHGTLHDGRAIDYILPPPTIRRPRRASASPLRLRLSNASATSLSDSSPSRDTDAEESTRTTAACLVGLLEPTDALAKDAEGKAECYFAKAVLRETREVLFCHVNGFTVKYQTLAEAEAGAVFSGATTMGVRALSARKKKRRAKECWRRAERNISVHYSSSGDDGIGDESSDKSRRTARMELCAEIFKRVDKDHSGALDIAEVRNALKRDASFAKLISGTGKEPVDVDTLFDAMDSDGDGKVRLSEMQTFVASGLDKESVVVQALHKSGMLKQLSNSTQDATSTVNAALAAGKNVMKNQLPFATSMGTAVSTAVDAAGDTKKIILKTG